VGASRVPVLTGGSRLGELSLDGRPLAPDGSNRLSVRVNVISDRYIEAMQIPMLAGRGFNPSDSAAAPRVAIVSRSLAKRLWPDQNPVGRSLGTSSAPTVIGVVQDTAYAAAVERDPPPVYYLPLAQHYESGVTLQIRTIGDPLPVLPAVREVVRAIDPLLVVARPRTLLDDFNRSVGAQRLMATVITIFGGLALVLAAIGLYGVLSQAAGQRRGEIGIRLALGARPASILTMIVGEGLRLVIVGSALGLAGALAAAQAIESRLFGVHAFDPGTYAGVSLLLIAVGVLACAIPARRARRVDPVVALRGS
jgi:predicted permease